MTLDSEDAVKKALGISSFREMSKEKTLALWASLPDVGKEVRLKLIEQIPGVQKFALDAIAAVRGTFEKSLDTNNESREQLHESLGQVRKVIEGRLEREGLSEEHERFLIERLIETGNLEAEKDSENKAFIAHEADHSRKAAFAIAGLGVVAAVVFAGGKIMLDRGGQASI